MCCICSRPTQGTYVRLNISMRPYGELHLSIPAPASPTAFPHSENVWAVNRVISKRSTDADTDLLTLKENAVGSFRFFSKIFQIYSEVYLL